MNSSSSARCISKRRIKPFDLSQILLSVAAVINDRGVHAIANGGQEGHQTTEAIAHDGNLTVAIRELRHGVGGILNVLGARVSVISLIEAKAVLPVGLGGNAEVDPRLLPPE